MRPWPPFDIWKISERNIADEDGRSFSKRRRRMSQVPKENEFASSAMRSQVEDEESILDVQVIGPESSLVSVLQQVAVVATVARGNNLQFTWDFGDGTDGVWTEVLSNDTSSRAVHEYGHAGEYTVVVKISNHIQEVSAKLEKPLMVVEPISDLVIIPVSGKYAAALEETRLGVFATEAVRFEARAHRGSHIEFLFDFGDGTSKAVPAKFDIMNTPYAIEGCIYMGEGVYNVSVLARNPLGNQTSNLRQLFTVQIAPKQLKLEHREYVTRKDGTILFRATVQPATAKVSYHWRFGHDVHLHNNDPEVNFTFTSVGTFTVAVEAYNFVTDASYDQIKRPKTEAKVFVETILKGVHLAVLNRNTTKSTAFMKSTSRPVVVSNGHILEWGAVLQDAQAAAHLFQWRFEGPVSTKFTTSTPQLKHAFTKAGRYMATVTAWNRSSKVTSQPVEVVVVRKLENLDEIRPPKSLLVQKSSLFLAHYQFGSNLTFRWDFGDGSPVREVASNDIHHTYEKVGEYLVNLNVYNAFSQANISTTVFVLDVECEKPYVRLLHPLNNSELSSNDDITFEASVDASCAITMEVDYQWDIIKNEKMGQAYDLRRLNQRSWVLRGNTLSSGSYTVSLKVQMTRTIVYSMVRAVFSLAPEPWKVRILGGSSRSLSFNDVVNIRTIPITNNDDIRYRWDCATLGQPRLPCFADQALAISGFGRKGKIGHYISFPASLLDSSSREFIVNVSATTKSHVTSSSSQILLILPRSTSLRLLVYCLSCLSRQNDIVTNNEFVSLISVCENNCTGDVEYEWKVWLILDGKHNLPHNNYNCVQPNGSTFYLNTSTSFNTDNGTLLNDTAGMVDNFDENLASESVESWFPDYVIEGMPGEAGSAAARNQASLGILDRWQRNVTEGAAEAVKGHRTKFGGSDMRDTTKLYSTTSHLFERPRKFVHLRSEDTTTGIDNSILIIKPGVLQVGRTYIIQRSARNKGRNLIASVTYTIKVDMAPVNGRCSVVPLSGVELITRFSLSCIEWKVGSRKSYLNYELRYRYKQKLHVLYKGYNNNFKFRLPSSVHEVDQQTHLEVLIRNKLGSTTHVCAISVQIDQLKIGNLSTEDILIREMTNSAGNFARAIAEKNYDDVSQQITIMSMMLSNSLTLPSATTNNVSRIIEIKMALVCAFKDLVANFTVQSRKFVHLITEIVGDSKTVNISIVKIAVGIIHQLLDYVPSFSDIEELHGVADSISSILETLHYLVSSKNISNEYCASTVSQLTSKFDYYLDRSFAKVFPVEQQPTIATKFYKIINYCVPHMANIVTAYNELGNNVSFFNCSCFRIWDYLNGSICKHKQDPLDLIQTNVQVVTKYSCSRNRIPSVKTIDTDFTVTSNPLPHFQNNTIASGLLRSDSIHAFKFNFEPHQDHVLIFDFTFANDTIGNFPIDIVISRNEVPNSKNIIRRWSVPEGAIYFNLQINKKNILQGFGQYFIALLNADTFSRRHFLRENYASVTYQMKAHWISCLHLDIDDNEWKSSGCEVDFKSTCDQIVCRCKKATQLGANLLPLLVTPIFYNVEEFIRPAMNLFPSVCVITIILVYIAIAIYFCRNGKQEAIILPGSSVKEKQVYLIELKTGICTNAGTSATVFIILYGENGVTETKELNGNIDRKCFQRGSTEKFIVRTSQNLGHVWKVHIWHNNTGFSPAWYLSNVTVVDVNYGRTFYFDCEKWLAVSEGDETVEVQLFSSHSMTISKALWKELSKAIMDFFIWGLAMFEEKGMKFSHMERLATSLSLVMIHCVLAATWASYKLFQLEITTAVHILSYNLIEAGALICAVSIPVYMTFELTFRTILDCGSCCDLNDCRIMSLKYNSPTVTVHNSWKKLQEWTQTISKLRKYSFEIWKSQHGETGAKNINVRLWARHAAMGIPVIAAIFCASVVSNITYRFTYKQTVSWVQTVLISMTLHIFLVQTIIAVLVAVARIVKKWQKFEIEYAKICVKHLDILVNSEDSVDIRSRKRRMRFARPPSKNEVIAAKNETMKENLTFNILRTLATSFGMLSLLVFMILGRNNTEMLFLNKAIHNTFMHTKPLAPLSHDHCVKFIEHFSGVFQLHNNTNEEVGFG